MDFLLWVIKLRSSYSSSDPSTSCKIFEGGVRGFGRGVGDFFKALAFFFFLGFGSSTWGDSDLLFLLGSMASIGASMGASIEASIGDAGTSAAETEGAGIIRAVSSATSS